MKSEILIINGILLPNPGSRETIPHGFVAVRDGVIAETGPMEDLPDEAADEIIDTTGCLVMPGLVNTHCHGAMTLFRGMADDMQLGEWLNNHIFPAEANHVDPEMVYWCSQLAAAEMLLSGTTLVADGYFHEGEAARAFSDTGIRAVAAHGIIDFPAPGVPNPAENIAVAARFVDTWKDRNTLVTPAVFAHSPYTCSPETLVRAKEMADDRNVSLFIHAAETAAEMSMIGDLRGDSPIKHLDALGILDDRTVCVHCIWVDADDMDILSRRKAKVAICPQSHMKLASGHAPLAGMLKSNIIVGLGTDGAASNNGLDLFREMDVCAKLQKARALDPVVVKASDILKMATVSGAEVLGLAGRAGMIEKGCPADLVVVDLQHPHLKPFYGPDILVYAAGGSDVRDVIVNGKTVVRNGLLQTIDLHEVMSRVRKIAQAIGR